MSNPWRIKPDPDFKGDYIIELNGVEMTIGVTANQLVQLSTEIVAALCAERNKRIEDRTDAS